MCFTKETMDSLFGSATRTNLNVLILLSESSNSTSHRFTLSNGENEIHGYIYTIWTRVKKELEKYFECTEIFYDGVINYDHLVEDVANRKYDIVIGLFKRNVQRSIRVKFCNPLVMDATVSLHKKKHAYFQILLHLCKYIIIVISLGIAFGIVLNTLDSNRQNKLNEELPQTISNAGLQRSILTAISSFYGEMGFLSERSTLTFKSMLVTNIMMAIAFVCVTLIQANVVSSVFEYKQNKEHMTIEQAKRKNFLGIEGYALIHELESHDVRNITHIDDTTENMIAMYEKNTDKYDGCIMSYTEASSHLKDYDVTTVGIDKYPLSWIMNHNEQHALRIINQEIQKMKENRELYNICQGYFPDEAYTCFQF